MFLVRHGQSEFNRHFSATKRDPGIPDPSLTEEGRAQAERAAELARRHHIRRIIASPYRRALQTAAPILAATGAQFTITPLVRERFAFICDIGSRASTLAADWPHHDFSTLEETWWPAATETPEVVTRRATQFRNDILALGDHAHTLVVSHWAFLLALTGRSLANGEWMEHDPSTPVPEIG